MGIVPNVRKVILVSTVTARNGKEETRDVAGAVANAADRLSRRGFKGDVLLIEALCFWVPLDGSYHDGSISTEAADKADQVPAEANPLTHAVVLAATTAGLVVVSAAGHSGADGAELDGHLKADSGSILVGAAMEDHPHDWIAGVNHGSRVTSWAWGDRVMTTTWDPDDPVDVYGYGKFKGTSAAAAIIAGAATAVQSMYLKEYEDVLTSTQMRAIFATVDYGCPATQPSPASAGGSARVAVMPNLRKIIDNELQLPYAYIRENTSDTGHALGAPLLMSPDIIVRNELYADPNAAIGPTSGTKDDLGLSEIPLAGHTNHIYVRVHNRNGRPTKKVDVNVFASSVAGVLRPELWETVGSTTVQSVPANDFAVARPIAWNPGAWPMTTFIAVIGVGGERPVRPSVLKSSSHLEWVRNECRAIAARAHYDVAPRFQLDADLRAPVMRLPFWLGVDPSNGQLAVRVRRTRGFGRLIGLEVDSAVAGRFGASSLTPVPLASRGTTILRFPPTYPVTIGPVVMRTADPVRANLVIRRTFLSWFFGTEFEVGQPASAKDQNPAAVTFSIGGIW